jgi:PIN domain nuclease of toxin-antitoxin system
LIVLDTHVWVKWVAGDPEFPARHAAALREHEAKGMGVSVISCWEVAMLVSGGRLELALPADAWIDRALAYPGVRLIDLTPRIAVESTRLPPEFHRDPADRILVATARTLGCPLVTADEKILAYPHVQTIGPRVVASD